MDASSWNILNEQQIMASSIALTLILFLAYPGHWQWNITIFLFAYSTNPHWSEFFKIPFLKSSIHSKGLKKNELVFIEAQANFMSTFLWSSIIFKSSERRA